MTEGLLSIEQFCQKNSVSRATFYREVTAGRLKAVKIGRKTAVTTSADRAWRDALPSYGRPETNEAA